MCIRDSSGMGPRGDVIVEADWCIGEMYKYLEDEGLIDNTIIIISSDNGPVLNDGYFDDAVEKLGDHDPFGGLRGGKYSLFEAGTRVPFITYWKGKIKPQVSNELVTQIDFLESFSSLIGSDIKSKDGIDLSDVFFRNKGQGRTEFVLEATSRTAFRQNNWVMIPPYKGSPFIESVNILKGSSENLVFGHWAALEGKTNLDNIIGLDTGCVWGNKLTAIRLEDKKLYQVRRK